MAENIYPETRVLPEDNITLDKIVLYGDQAFLDLDNHHLGEISIPLDAEARNELEALKEIYRRGFKAVVYDTDEQRAEINTSLLNDNDLDYAFSAVALSGPANNLYDSIEESQPTIVFLNSRSQNYTRVLERLQQNPNVFIVNIGTPKVSTKHFKLGERGFISKELNRLIDLKVESDEVGYILDPEKAIAETYQLPFQNSDIYDNILEKRRDAISKALDAEIVYAPPFNSLSFGKQISLQDIEDIENTLKGHPKSDIVLGIARRMLNNNYGGVTDEIHEIRNSERESQIKSGILAPGIFKVLEYLEQYAQLNAELRATGIRPNNQ